MLRIIAIFMLSVGLYLPLSAQSRTWQSYSTEDFNYYYSSDLQDEAKSVNFKFKEELFTLQNTLNYHLNGKVDVFLVSHWTEQEHLGQDMLIKEDNEAGRVSSMAQRVILDLSSDPRELMASFRQQVALVIFNEMMYGGSLQDQMRSANLIYFPDWFVEGLMYYLGHGWSVQLDNDWRAVFEIYGIRRFNDIPEQYDHLKGAAFAKFLQDKYGADALSNLLYMSRLTRKLNSGLYYSFQSNAREVFRMMVEFYTVAYTLDQRKRIPIKGLSMNPDKFIDFLAVDSETFYALRRSARGVCLEKWQGSQRRSVLYTLGPNERPLGQFAGSIQSVNGELYLFYKTISGVVQRQLSNGVVEAVRGLRNAHWIKVVDERIYVLSSGLITSQLYRLGKGGVLMLQKNFEGYIRELVWDRDQVITTRVYMDSVNVLSRITDDTVTLLSSTSRIEGLALRRGKLLFNWGVNGVMNGVKMDLSTGEYVFLTDYRASISHHQVSDSFLAEYVERLDGSALFLTVLDEADPSFEYDSITPIYFSGRVVEEEKGFVSSEYDPELDSLPDYTFQTPFPRDKDFRLSNYDSLKAEADKNYLESGQVLEVENFFHSNSVIVQLYNGLNGVNSLPFESAIGDFLPNTLGVRIGGSVLNQFNDQTLRGSYLGFRLINYERDVNLQYINRRYQHPFSLQFFHRQRLTIASELEIYKNRSHLGIFSWTWFEQGGWSVQNAWQYRNDEKIGLSANKKTLEKPSQFRQRLSTSLDLLFDNAPFLYWGWKTNLKASLMPYYMVSASSAGVSLRLNASAQRKFSPWFKLDILARGGLSMGKHPEYFVLGGTPTDLLADLYPRDFSTAKQASYYTMIYGVRGFDPNYRNGTTFGLSTVQLTWKPLQQIYRRPIFSELLNHISIVGFGDIATSFYGNNYTDPSNALNSRFFTTPGQSFDILVKNVKNPLIGALGVGLHGKLYSYDLALDWAYGIESGVIRSPKFHLSLAKYIP